MTLSSDFRDRKVTTSVVGEVYLNFSNFILWRFADLINKTRATSHIDTFWVNCNDLTVLPSPGNHGFYRGIIPKWPQDFRLVKYDNLPIYIYTHSYIVISYIYIYYVYISYNIIYMYIIQFPQTHGLSLGNNMAGVTLRNRAMERVEAWFQMDGEIEMAMTYPLVIEVVTYQSMDKQCIMIG
jgi:hypothetical protein